MNIYTILLAFSIFSLNANANPVPSQVSNYLNGFISQTCHSAPTEIELVSYSSEEIDQGQKDHFYTFDVYFEDQIIGAVKIGRYDISNPQKANLKVLKNSLPFAFCKSEKSELQVTCGSHWHEVSLTLPLTHNVGNVFISGDGVSTQSYQTKYEFNTDQNIIVKMQSGELQLVREYGEWSATLKTHSGARLNLHPCMEHSL